MPVDPRVPTGDESGNSFQQRSASSLGPTLSSPLGELIAPADFFVIFSKLRWSCPMVTITALNKCLGGYPATTSRAHIRGEKILATILGLPRNLVPVTGRILSTGPWTCQLFLPRFSQRWLAGRKTSQCFTSKGTARATYLMNRVSWEPSICQYAIIQHSNSRGIFSSSLPKRSLFSSFPSARHPRMVAWEGGSMGDPVPRPKHLPTNISPFTVATPIR